METVLNVPTAELTADLSKKLADYLRVIADERRLRILAFLHDGERCVCEITEALNISQPLASYHLAMLREAGFVRDRRDARWAYYSINPERLQELNALYWQLFDPQRISTAPQRETRVRCR